MASKKKQSSWGTILLLIVGVVGWYLKENPEFQGGSDKKKSVDTVAGLTEAKVTTDEFTVIKGCRLINHRNNDGDSFYIEHPNGKEEIRLYFVDTAESRLHQYNGKRIAEQGEYFGGLTQKQTIDIGIEGKKLTLGLLKGKSFTVLTKGDMDPSGKRPHMYVLIEKDGKQYYLHEILAQSGLVRTRTYGTNLPDGTKFRKQREKVRALEAEAKRAKRGAWGVK